ncbi:MAG: hydantoinase/oxoprolinase family protein, partial [Betaproteobacteria bacterium]
SIDEAAWGVHRVANATMARALRAVSTERGRDPRDLVVLAFGGNGPVHAATLARLLDIHKILVPPVPGLFSALGMLFPEIEHHYVRTCKQRLDGLDVDALEASFGALQAEGAAALNSEGYGTPVHRFERLIDLRYAGANSELTLPCPTDQNIATILRRLFGEAHERQYGYRSDAEIVETMNVRVIARAATASTRVPDRLALDHGRAGGDAIRAAYFGPEFGSIETPVCSRSAVGPQWRNGPLLIEEFDSTTVVPPDGRARLGNWDTIEIELA